MNYSIKPQLFSIVLSSLLLISISDLSAKTIIVKHRDHIGIFNGYGMVREIASEIPNGTGTADTRIDIYCEGSGDMKCRTDLATPLEHDNGGDFTEIEYNKLAALDIQIINKINNGMTTGQITESFNIGYPDGTIIPYIIIAEWEYINGKYVITYTIE